MTEFRSRRIVQAGVVLLIVRSIVKQVEAIARRNRSGKAKEANHLIELLCDGGMPE